MLKTLQKALNRAKVIANRKKMKARDAVHQIWD
jgi:hypothetical protein